MITVSDVLKNHGRLQVLNRVSLAVQRGEGAAGIWASGGGKTTLLRCINGLEPFDEGTVQVDGISLQAGIPSSETVAQLRRLRRQVGMVFQQFHLFPHMSVLRNVASGPMYVLG